MKLLWADVVPSCQSYITLATAALYSQQCSCFAHPDGIVATLNQRWHQWRTRKNQRSPEWAQIHTERRHQIRKPMHFLTCLHFPTSQTQGVRIHFSHFSCWLWSWECDSLAAKGLSRKEALLWWVKLFEPSPIWFQALWSYTSYACTRLVHLTITWSSSPWWHKASRFPQAPFLQIVSLQEDKNTNLHVGKRLFCNFNIFSGPDCLYASYRKGSKHPRDPWTQLQYCSVTTSGPGRQQWKLCPQLTRPIRVPGKMAHHPMGAHFVGRRLCQCSIKNFLKSRPPSFRLFCKIRPAWSFQCFTLPTFLASLCMSVCRETQTTQMVGAQYDGP